MSCNSSKGITSWPVSSFLLDQASFISLHANLAPHQHPHHQQQQQQQQQMLDEIEADCCTQTIGTNTPRYNGQNSLLPAIK